MMCNFFICVSCKFDKHCTRREDHKPVPESVRSWASFKQGDMMVFENKNGERDTCFYGPWVESEYFIDCTFEGKDCCVRNYETSLENNFSPPNHKKFNALNIKLNPANTTVDLILASVGIHQNLNNNPSDSCSSWGGNDCLMYSQTIIYSNSKGFLQFADYNENKNITLWKRVF